MMELVATYWYMFPIALVFTSIAIATWVGSAAFYVSFFILALELDPITAVGAALVIELFGFTSGIFGYAHMKLIDYGLVRKLLWFIIPFAIVGSFLADMVPSRILELVLGFGILFIAFQMYCACARIHPKHKNKWSHESKIIDRDGNKYTYTIDEPITGNILTAIGGLMVGLISAGMSEMQEYFLIVREKVPIKVAIPTTIFIVFITAVTAAFGHVAQLIYEADETTLSTIINLAIFAAPGALIAGQFGVYLEQHLNPKITKAIMATAFIFIGMSLIFS